LAGGQINQSDRLSIELIKTADDREMTVIVWPKRPTPVSARKLSETVATVCRILSNAVIEVAARRQYR
jgi:hypothetical protein